MKKSFKLILGVTLIEIVLVLEIVGIILIQVAKFYQVSANAQYAADVMRKYGAIVSTLDSLAAGSTAGGYASLPGIGTGGDAGGALVSLLGSQALSTPWACPNWQGGNGGCIVIHEVGNACSNSTVCFYIYIFGVPAGVCDLLHAQMKSDSHIVGWGDYPGTSRVYPATPCPDNGSAADLTYTYSSTGSAS